VVARAICLRQLTLAPRTKAQLARAMARRNVPEDVAERVLERFEEVGLIDDAAFAAAWVDSRHAGRGLGRRALAHELRQRGVPDPLVRAAVDELDPEQELAAARQLVAQRLPALARLDPRARARRLSGMLVRKGYSAGLAYRVIRETLEIDTDASETDAVIDESGSGTDA
jgi:regulatory protein